MSTSELRVVKVGGSLFEVPDLTERLQRWLTSQTPATHLFVAGGGPLAESIRELDRVHRIGEVPAHWLCIRAMGVTARLLVDLLPDTAMVDNLDDVRSLLASRPERSAVFDPMPVLLDSEPALPGTNLPHGWTVTSDSIAARVAELLSADELVLLKSDLPGSTSFKDISGAGYVDEFFSSIAGQLPRVRCVNLRAEEFQEVSLS